MNMKRKLIAILLAIALVAGLLPLQTPIVSRAAGYDISNPSITGDVTTWDCIWFGNYWQSAIKTTGVVNEDNPVQNTEGGYDTSDKVYLLSIGEAMNSSYEFTDSKDATVIREAVNTAYAKTKGASTSNGNGYWWLRSPGYSNDRASSVGVDGKVYTNDLYDLCLCKEWICKED